MKIIKTNSIRSYWYRMFNGNRQEMEKMYNILSILLSLGIFAFIGILLAWRG